MAHRSPLVVHAGFPKCATSSLQHLFYSDDHRLCRELGLTWIGKGIEPFGHGAPVSEIMYDPAGTAACLAKLPITGRGSYFLSSEALASNIDFFDALGRIFDTRKIILTIRMPLLVALSEYCFSGWLTILPKDVDLNAKANWFATVIGKLSAMAPLALCPVEKPKLATRFCDLVAGRSPPWIETRIQELGSANQSMPLALAAVLSHMLRNRLATPIPGPLRGAFARVGRINRGAPEFGSVLPPVLYGRLRQPGFAATHLAAYERVLRDANMPIEDIQTVLDVCRSRLTQLLERPEVTPDLVRAMQVHGDWLLRHVQNDTPETRNLFRPEFRVT